jgi:SAM-dependent methyltransferase
MGSTKWNERFTDATSPGRPASVLADNQHLLPANGRALDLACGLGGNALLLASRGLQVDALDSSSVALAKLTAFAHEQNLPVTAQLCDIERDWRPRPTYDVIVCSHYLHRPACAHIVAALKPGGLLYYQTFTIDKLTSAGPSTQHYLLCTGELLSLFQGLAPIYYREDARYGDLNYGQRDTASLVASKAGTATL